MDTRGGIRTHSHQLSCPGTACVEMTNVHTGKCLATHPRKTQWCARLWTRVPTHGCRMTQKTAGKTAGSLSYAASILAHNRDKGVGPWSLVLLLLSPYSCFCMPGEGSQAQRAPVSHQPDAIPLKGSSGARS